MLKKDGIEIDEERNASINEALGFTSSFEKPEQGKDWFDFILNTKTGKGSIESYDKHDLNFTKTRGTAHIIRGIVGFFGNTDRAIVDVLVGGLMELKRLFLDEEEEKGSRTKAKGSRKDAGYKVEVL